VTDTQPQRTDSTDATDAATEQSAIAVERDVLREENRQLRAAYRRAQRTTYRRTALGFVGVGALAVAGGLLFPDARTVLFALGGTGLFAGVLTYYLTPERFLAAGVGHDVYRALADTGERLVDELGLTAHRRYVPAEGPHPAWLFVPQHEGDTVPGEDALQPLFVVGEEADDRARGVSLRPTGTPLFERFEEGLPGSLAETPGPLATQLADGVVEQFELATNVRTDVARDGTGTVDGEDHPADVVVSFGVTDPTIPSVARFDHPIPSFLAVGLARGLARPVDVTITEPEEGRADVLVTCRVVAEGGT
jgi:hypothetical protein